MNRIYKVVWCHVRNTYVVASELASRKKIKSKSGSLLKPIAVALGMTIAASSISNAATGIDGGSGDGTAISQKRKDCKTEAYAQQKGNIAIGCESEAKDSVNTYMFDRGNPDNEIDSVSTFSSIAIGAKSKADKAAVSIGAGSESTELGVAFGSQARSRGIAAIALGAAALSTGNTSLALGRQSAATADFSQAIGNVALAKGKGSLAMGHSATATGNRSIAIGSADIDSAGSTGDQQGTMYQTKQQTLSTGKDSIAIGAAAKAEGVQTLAVGAHARASGSNSTAMGFDSSATGADAFAAGRSAKAEGQDAFALGANAHGQGIKSFAMGTLSKAIGENALALGSLSVAKEKNSIAVGVGAQANFADSVALGSGAIVKHDNSISIGTKSTTNDYNATAFLFEEGVAGAVATGAVSIGNGKGAISPGSTSNERRLQNLAAGSLDTDAVNVSQLRKFKVITDKSASDVADHLGGDSKYNPKTGDVTKPTYNITNKEGNKTKVYNVGSALDIIDGNVVSNTNNINNIIKGKSGLVQLSGDNKKIIIDNKLAKEATSFNIGNGSVDRTLSGVAKGVADNDAVNVAQLKEVDTKVGDNTTLITSQGDKITTIINKQDNSLNGIEEAFGAGAEFDKDGKLTSPNYSEALGLADDQKIGSGVEEGFKHVGGKLADHDQSITNIEGDINNITTGKAGLVKLSDIGEIVIDNDLADKATFNLANKDGSARTLTGVAKGKVAEDSVDAINGSQLHAANTKVAEVIGGGAEVDAEGNLTDPTFNITDVNGAPQEHNTVGDALEALDAGVVNNTTNITNLETKTGESLSGIAEAFGAGAEFDKDGKLTSPNYSEALGLADDQKIGSGVEEGFKHVGGKLADHDQSITNIEGDINNITTGKAGLVKLSDIGEIVIDNDLADKATFNLANKDGSARTLTGVAKGKVAEDSVDAINGSQLHAANTKVAEVIGGGAKVDAEGNLTDPTFNITDVNGKQQGHNTVGDALEALDAGVVNNTTNITNLEEKSGASLEGIAEALGGNAAFDKDSGVLSGVDFKDALGADAAVESVYDGFGFVKGKIDGLTNGEAGLVKLGENSQIVIDNEVAADYDTFNIANVDADGKPVERTLTGVAKGKVAEDSVDAINGSQLHAANTKVAEVIGGGAKVDAEGNLTDPTFNITDVNGAPQEHNTVGDALEALDAGVVNNTTNITNLEEKSGASLEGIAEALGGNAAFDKDSGILSGVDFKDALGADAAVESVYDGFGFVKGKIDGLTDGKAGLVKLGENGQIVIDNEVAADYDTFNIANVDADGKPVERTLTGVAKGKVAEDSVDAINGSQLHAANTKVAEVIGGGAEVDAEGNLTDPTFNITDVNGVPQEHNTVGDALEALDAGVVNNTTNITNLEAKSGASLEGIAEALGGNAAFDKDSGILSGVDFKDALGADATVESVYDGFGFVKGKIDGLTNGEAGLVKLGENGQIVIDNEVAADYDTFNIANVDADGKPVERTLTGVAKGKVAADSVDAINGSQLFTAKEDLANIIAKDIINADGSIDAPKFVETIKVVQKDAEGKPVLDDKGNPVLVEQKQAGFDTIKEAIDSLGQGNATIADSLGGGSTVNVDGSITGPTYNITNKDGDTVTVNNVGDALTTIDNSVTNITNGKSGLVQLSDNNKTIIIDNELAKEATSFNIAGKDTERKLTGVANGDVNADSVDAINGSQLFDAKKDLADIIAKDIINADGSIEAPTFIDTIQVVKKDAEGNVELDDAGNPILVTQTQDGFNTIKEAIDSLGQGNATIADSLGGGSVVNLDGSITGPTYVINGDKYHNVGDAITNIDGRVIDNTTKIDDITNNITTGKAGLVQLDGNKIVIDNNAAKSANTFDISNGKDARKLTGVAKGEIDANSVDAINGGQLFDIGKYVIDHAASYLGGDAEAFHIKDGENKDRHEVRGLDFRSAFDLDDDEDGPGVIDTVYGAFDYLHDSIENGEIGLLQMKDGKLVFSDVAKKATEFDVSGENGSAMKVTNVDAGEVSKDSSDAINGSQLYATNQSIVDSLGGGAEVNADGSITGPTYVINGGSYNNVGDAITNIDGRVIDNTKNITNLTENINNINNGKAGLVMIDGDRIVFDSSIAGGRTFDISNKGQARKMTGVADGMLAAGSKDAVNGGQLYDTNQNVAKNSDNISKTTDALGGGAGIDKDGNYKGPNYSFTDGSNHTNVGSALDNLDGRVDTLDKKVDGIANGTEGLVKLETDKDGNQKLVIDNNLASKADTFDISNGDQDRTLTGVADGKIAKDSKDAINGSQLHGSNSTIADIFGGGATVDKDGFVSMPEYDFGDKNVFNNVGESLAHLNNKIKAGEGGLFQMSADGKTVVLGDSAKTATTVDMGNRVIAGVANGKVEKDSLDAVNGGQLWETNQNVSSNTNQIKHINNTLNHYNTRLNNLEKTVHENRKRASAGTASAMAMSSIPYLDYAKYSFGMGVASYDGEAAMSMGLEFRMGDNGRFRIQGSYDTQNKAGVGVGMAFEL